VRYDRVAQELQKLREGAGQVGCRAQRQWLRLASMHFCMLHTCDCIGLDCSGWQSSLLWGLSNCMRPPLLPWAACACCLQEGLPDFDAEEVLRDALAATGQQKQQVGG
jgi:hypothetical protein